MPLIYYVRCIFRDGTVVLSHPFTDRHPANRWAANLRRSRQTVRRVFVIARPVRPIGTEPPAGPTAA